MQDDNTKFCPKCGGVLAVDGTSATCAKCGAKLSRGYGHWVESVEGTTPDAEKKPGNTIPDWLKRWKDQSDDPAEHGVCQEWADLPDGTMVKCSLPVGHNGAHCTKNNMSFG